jgi:hypothetical protein
VSAGDVALVSCEVVSVDVVVTVMSTWPLPDGGVAVIDVALLTVKVALVPPNNTLVVE